MAARISLVHLGDDPAGPPHHRDLVGRAHRRAAGEQHGRPRSARSLAAVDHGEQPLGHLVGRAEAVDLAEQAALS